MEFLSIYVANWAVNLATTGREFYIRSRPPHTLGSAPQEAEHHRQLAVTMAMARVPILIAVALVAAAASCSAWEPTIRMPTAEAAAAAVDDAVAPLIHALRPLLGSSGELGSRGGVPCDSWRLGVEAYNVRDWKTVPANCEGYVGHYMLGSHFRRDSKVVIDQAIAYVDSLKLAGNGKEVWVFDIDETTLSNLPYYATHGFGARPYNATSFDAYVLEGTAPVLPETKRLYYKLLKVGIKPVFITGRTEDKRAITVGNLRSQGISGWMNLTLKQPGFHGSAISYKSAERKKLQDAGYVIVGNIGDQWSDLLGAPEGARTFKLPDPLYYIS
ncbi:hypothetical protein VPH35_069590 [Triticum aestivum]